MMKSPGVGIIGTGWGARVQVPAFRAAGLEVVALAGTQAKKTQRIAADLNIPYATGDWHTLLERDEVSLISIVTPPVLHCEMSIESLRAGKHVLCEKPTAFDSLEATKMLEVAQAYAGQIALVDHELRFLPAIQEARNIVASGGIGHLRHVEARFINNSRANTQRAWNWWSDASQGGGILGAICSHQIDTMRYILNDEITMVQGFLNTFVTERPLSFPEEGHTMRKVTSEDFATCCVQFARGGVGIITASMVASMSEFQSFTFYGDAGTLRFIDGILLYAQPHEPFQEITPTHTIEILDTIQSLYPDYASATVYMGYALCAAMQGDRDALAPAATFADGLSNQQVIDAVRRSGTQTKGWVRVGV